MNEPYKISFATLVAVVFSLPIFFIPSTLIPLGVAKMALLAVGSIVAFVAFLFDTWKLGRIAVPKTHLLWTAVALPLAYLLSSLFSGNPGLSMFGYTFEVGTFAFVLMGSALFAVAAFALNTRSRILKVYSAFFLSLLILSVFMVIKVVSGGSLLILDNFSGSLGNPIGAWTDLAVVFGLLSIISVFAIEMLRRAGSIKWLLYIIYALSVAFLIIINFAVVWMLVFVAALLIFVYFTTVERRIDREDDQRRPNLWPVGVLLAVSLLFLFNPTVSSRGTIGDAISSMLHISNTDIRPSLPTTLGVDKAVLAKNPIVGSGPNTFDKDWLMYKPQAINATTFWQSIFASGFGFLPSQLATVGLLGGLVWAGFVVLLFVLAAKAIKKTPHTRAERSLVISSGLASIFLVSAAFFYAPSVVVLALAFIFAGVFVATSRSVGTIGVREVVLTNNALLNFVSVLLLIVFGIGALAFGVVTFQKTLSIYHFEKAIALSQVAGTDATSIETELGRAISFAPNDLYYGTLSQFEESQAKVFLQNIAAAPEKNRLAFQDALSKTIAAAQAAVNANKSYQEWIALGSLYEALVPTPLSIPGAFESAQSAYAQAQQLNPLTPEVSLLMAKLDLDHKDSAAARKDVNQALTLKPDYADAYFFLAQLESSENNVSQAIDAAKAGAVLSPGNAGIYFELGLLEYTNKKYQDAATAFIQALSIEPDYANAKYFLGLSYEALGRHTEAISEFKDLNASNPGNADIQSVLANLRAGRDPFGKPADVSPLKTSTPPIKSTGR